MIASTLASRYVPADSHGGAFRAGQPRIIVIHSIECPLGNGWASDLAVNWMQHADVSVHYIVDPGQVVQCLDETLIGWGAGTVNSAAIHIEQSGYARFSRAEWTTPDGRAQVARLGALVADIASRHGIPLRWLTDAQLRAAFDGSGPGGLATHSDCTRVIGGTTHTDPGANYPRDLLLVAATGGSHAESSSTIDVLEGIDMTPQELSDLIDARLRAALTDPKTIGVARVDVAQTPNQVTDSIVGTLSRLARLTALSATDTTVAPHVK